MTMDDTKTRIQTTMKLADWGSVLLARLNHFFKNETLCDLTLRLCSSESVKMHRVILHACTDYFDSILSPDTNSLDLDDSFPADIMLIIIKFMYTGQVNNLNAEIYDDLYKMASVLRIQILVDHLDAAKKQGANLIEVRSNSPLPAEVLRPVVTNENSTPKRMSVWARKSVPVAAHKKTNPCNVPLVLSSNTMIRFVLTKPFPTRFECEKIPCDDFPITIVGDALKFMSYENDIPLHQPLILDDSVMSDSSTRPSPAKRPRDGSDLTNMKEFGQQQKIRNELMMEEDEEDVDDPAEMPQSGITPKPILKSVQRADPETPKRVRFHEGSQESTFADQTYIPVATIPHPDTKVEKIEYAGTGELLVTSNYGKADTSKRVQYSVLPLASGNETISEVAVTVPGVDNPAKIVSEVLKKYPDLVTGRRKNIKLKVMTNPPSEGSVAPSASYIFIKDAGNAKTDYSYELNPEAEAPWLCTPCGKEDYPLHFSTYGEFRQHIVAVHNVKISPKLCEHCGHRVPNFNHMTYHHYVKHKIKPPSPDLYPKCALCSHISLSHNMLARHVEMVHGSGSLVCESCNVAFKSQSLYKSHLRSEWHTQRQVQMSCDYPCPFCDAEFSVGAELKSHIEAQHQKKEKERTEPEEAEKEKTDEGKSQSPKPKENNSEDPIITDAPHASDEKEKTVQIEKDQEVEQLVIKENVSTPLKQIDSKLPEDEEEEEEVEEKAQEEVPDQPEAVETQTTQIEEKTTQVESNELIQNELPKKDKKVTETASQADQTDFVEPSQESEAVEYSEDQPDNPEVYDNDSESESPELEISFDSKPDDVEDVEESKDDFESEKSFPNESYEPMEIDETVQTEDTDGGNACEESDTAAGDQQGPENREAQGDHDYSPYNSMVMFQPNIVLPPRVMLVTHPIAHPLQTVFMPAPNIISDQIVLPFPQCGQMQMVNNGQVVSTTAQVVTTSVSTECVQVVRERKVEPETLANDWDESSQTEAATQPVLQPGVGPSRAEFF